MPNANPSQRDDESQIGDSCDQPVEDRLAATEDLLLEMQHVQELQLKRMKRLEALFDTLAERIELNRGHVPALALRGMRHPLRRRGDLGKARS